MTSCPHDAVQIGNRWTSYSRISRIWRSARASQVAWQFSKSRYRHPADRSSSALHWDLARPSRKGVSAQPRGCCSALRSPLRGAC